MKTTTIISLLLIFILSFSASAQQFDTKNYTWDIEASTYTLPDSLSEEKAIIIFKTILIDFDAEADSGKEQHFVEHKKIYLNSDDAVEQNNKIYIGNSETSKSIIQARVIHSNGEVKTLNEKDIKTGVDEDSGVEYSYYAVEGLRVGSILETMVSKKSDPNLYGRIIKIQSYYPTLKYDFQHSYPSFLEFAFKTYNTNLSGKATKEEDIKYYNIHGENIPKYEVEPVSLEGVNMYYLVYKLDKNHGKNLNDINSYGHYSQIIAERSLNINYNKATKKDLDKLFKKIPLTEGLTDLEKVVIIENYIKNNYVFVDNLAARELESITFILSNKAFNSFGAIQLYQAMLSRVGLSCSVVATCNKDNLKFDKTFEAYVFLNKTLLFVNEMDLIMDVEDPDARLSYFNPLYQGIDGLFIKSKTVGGITTALGKVKQIPASKADDNITRAEMKIDLTEGFDEMDIKVTKTITGHVAKNFQPFVSKVDKDNMERFQEYVLYMHDDNFIPETVKFENSAAEDFPLKPFIQHYEIENEDYWEKGGPNYILKLGEFIGGQSQLYHDNAAERKTDIFSPYARRYQYTINFNIPEGFEVANLDDINFDIKSDFADSDFYFNSKYLIEDDLVKVTVDELYDADFYPASYFESYQKVINAAADFQKVKLIFQKK